MNELDRITLKIGENHEGKARYEKGLKSAREEFFSLATQELERTNLARTVVEVPVEVSIPEYVGIHHPGWRIVTQDAQQVLIEEDPAFLPFVYVNPYDGKKYHRNVSQPQPLLDDERVQAEDLALWGRVSEIPEPWGKLLTTLLQIQDHEIFEVEHIAIPRVLRSPEDIDPADLIALEPYFVPAPITLRLESPKKADEENA